MYTTQAGPENIKTILPALWTVRRENEKKKILKRYLLRSKQQPF